LVLARAGMAR